MIKPCPSRTINAVLRWKARTVYITHLYYGLCRNYGRPRRLLLSFLCCEDTFAQNLQHFFVPFKKHQIIPAVFIRFDLAEAIDFERSYYCHGTFGTFGRRTQDCHSVFHQLKPCRATTRGDAVYQVRQEDESTECPLPMPRAGRWSEESKSKASKSVVRSFSSILSNRNRCPNYHSRLE